MSSENKQITEHDPLYKIDTKGNVRVWWMESTDTAHRTNSGIQGGKIVTSGWKTVEEKNIGKSNFMSKEEQVRFEVQATYEKQLYQGRYHRTIEDAENGALFVEPMLAEKFSPNKHTDYPYASNPKLDGVRCIISATKMQTRRGKDFASCPHIFEALRGFFKKYPDAILDGELYNHDLKHDFEKIVSLVRKSKPTKDDLDETREKVEFHVYDVITPEEMPYPKRYEFLVNDVAGLYRGVKIIPCKEIHNLEEAETTLNEYIRKGYEGQILRDMKTPYEHRRSKSLLKHKNFHDMEVKIVDVREGQGNWAGYAKSVDIELEDGTTQESGMRGNFEFAKKILENREALIGTEATVRYQGKLKSGRLQFPVIVKFWEGVRDV